MDSNFENVPLNYLRANRGIFINAQYCLQLDDVKNPDTQKGRHWYVDAVAYEPGARRAFLCEFTFSQNLEALKKKMVAWAQVWKEIECAVHRDSGISDGCKLRPWIFIPENHIPKIIPVAKKTGFDGNSPLPILKLTALEDTLPWRYDFWKRPDEIENQKIPVKFR